MNQVIKERIEKIKHGEVPEGYKSTKSGTIPFSWDSIKLRKLATPIKEKVQNRKLEVLSITAGVGFVNQADKFGKEIAGAQYQNYTVLRKGDFSYNKGNSKTYPQGCIYMLEDRDEAAVPSVFNSFRFKPGFHTYYYKHLFINSFLNRQLFRYINAGVRNDGLLNLYDDDFYDCELPVPSLPEQEKIAEILSTWDKAIFLMENLIEQKKKQQKWLMQNLLDPDSGIRLPGFKGEWKEKNIGELFKFLSSVPASRDQLGNKGFCYLHYGDIHKSKMTYINVEDEYESIPKLSIDKVPDNAILQDGDVVFVDASEDYEGASKYIVVENKFNRPFIAGLHTIGIRSKNDELNNEFKKYCFQSYNIKKQISFYASGIKVYGLSRDNLAKLIVKFPNIDEQEAIANILSTADKEIYLLEQKLEQLQKQKKALMQLLLTGIVRVTA